MVSNGLEHEATPPNLAIHNWSCYFGKFIGKFWQLAAAFQGQCFIFRFLQAKKKPASPYENREKRVLYYCAFFVLSARSRNRTGTPLQAGDFKSGVKTFKIKDLM